jgi:hypothetical protein
MKDDSPNRGKIWDLISSFRPPDPHWDAVIKPHVDYFEYQVDLARYFARYPAELADDLADDYLKLLENDDVTEFSSWFAFLSIFCRDECWWRLFESQRPHCPINFQVFTDFHRAIHDEDQGTFLRIRDHDLRRELQMLALWIDTEKLWDVRPSEEGKRWHVMKRIVGQNPKLRAKGEPDSIMKRFRLACKDEGLPGINQSEGLAMIREIKGVPKRRRGTD